MREVLNRWGSIALEAFLKAQFNHVMLWLFTSSAISAAWEHKPLTLTVNIVVILYYYYREYKKAL